MGFTVTWSLLSTQALHDMVFYSSCTNGGLSSSNYAGWFDGNVHVTGAISTPSDRKFKTDIRSAESVLGRLNQLQVKEYSFRDELLTTHGFPAVNQTGFISQEVAEIFPDLVKVESMPEKRNETGEVVRKAEGYMSVNYIGLVPILTKGMQEQQEIIESQQTKIETLEQRIDRLEQLIQQK